MVIRRCRGGGQRCPVIGQRLAISLDGDRFGLGIDADDLMARPEVDIALVAELFGRHSDEVLQVLDLGLI
nr:hypothetical protein [Haloglomus irregulare]